MSNIFLKSFQNVPWKVTKNKKKNTDSYRVLRKSSKVAYWSQHLLYTLPVPSATQQILYVTRSGATHELNLLLILAYLSELSSCHVCEPRLLLQN